MIPIVGAMFWVWVTSSSSRGRMGKMRPMPTASRATAEKMTIRGLFMTGLQREQIRVMEMMSLPVTGLLAVPSVRHQQLHLFDFSVDLSYTRSHYILSI